MPSFGAAVDMRILTAAPERHNFRRRVRVKMRNTASPGPLPQRAREGELTFRDARPYARAVAFRRASLQAVSYWGGRHDMPPLQDVVYSGVT